MRDRVGFAIGTGRCGTKFLAHALALEPGVASVHERNPLNETFHRYAKWYGLPIDDEGFLQTKEQEIRGDLDLHHFSFEASAHLSLSVRELYDRFGARFVLLVRSPERVVNSYLRKGWYAHEPVRAVPERAPGYQPALDAFHHTLGRIMPSGVAYERWKTRSRVGRLAWYWNALNAAAIQQLEALPQDRWRIEKLEELSYHRYRDVVRFFGFESRLSRKNYDALACNPPNAKRGVPTTAEWSEAEAAEFEAEAAPMAERLGYGPVARAGAR